MIAALLDHLWQSTLFAGGAALLVLALSRNEARIRHGVWLAASMKFLVPFSLLTALGARLAPAIPPIVKVADLKFAEQSVRPFAASLPATLPSMPGFNPVVLLFTLWLAGFLAVLLGWFVRWRHIRGTLRQAAPFALAAPIPVKITPLSLGPALFGIFRPVLLLPQGIVTELTPRELRAILDHELCHLERNDNLTTTIHMIVEALFWFHPLVWWLGARLIAERERACDQNVVASGNEAGTYAEGILKVCRFYAAPPLASAVLSDGLESRLESIMAGRAVAEFGLRQKALIGIFAALAIAWPVMTGWSGAVRSEIVKLTGPVTDDAATLAALRRYVAQHQPGSDRFADSGSSYENTSSRADCETHFLAVLQTLEKSYGKFVPLYPERARNDRDQLPMSLTWKNGLGNSRYQEATVYMNDETAHVWDARKLLDGRHIDAAAAWSADSESANSVCVTEINIKA